MRDGATAMTDTLRATGSPGRHPLLAAVLLAGGLAGVWWGLRALENSPFAPIRPEAFVRPGAFAALVALLCGTAVLGALMGTGVRRGIRWVIALPVLLAGSAGLAWGLVTQCVPPDWTLNPFTTTGAAQHRAVWLTLRFVSAWGAGLLYVTLGGGLAGSLLTGRRGRWATSVMLLVAAVLGMGATLLARQSVRSDVLQHLRAGHAGPLAAMALLMLIGACAAWVACAGATSRAKALAAGLVATVASAAPGWLLLHQILPESLVRTSLAGPLAAEVSDVSLVLRWCLMQWSATGLLAWGYVVVLCVLPDRKKQGQLPFSPPPASAPPDSIAPSEHPSDQKSATGKTVTVPVFPARPGRVYLLLALAFAAFVVYGSLVPLRYRPVPFERAMKAFGQLRWHDVTRMHRTDLAINCMLGVILGYLAMGAITRGGRRRGAGWIGALLVPPAVLGVAVTAEFLQIYFLGRTPTLNDIAAQTGGAIVGVMLWLLTGRAVTAWATSLWRQRVGDQTAVKVLAGYVVGLAMYQLWPFDLSPSPADIWRHYKAGMITPVPFTDRVTLTPYMLIIKTALLMPVGYMIWMAVRAARAWWAVVGGLAVAAGIELGQAMVASRYASTTDIVLGGAGAALGAWLAGRLSPRSARPWPRRKGWGAAARITLLAALAGWAALLVRAQWSPFDFQSPGESVWAAVGRTLRVPFYHLYRPSVMTAMTQVARRLGWFFVLGVLVRGLLGAGRGGKWAAGTIGALLAPWLRQVLLASPLPPADASG